MNNDRLPRLSRPNFPYYLAARKNPVMYAFMFERDLPLGILPYRSRANDQFKIELDPYSSDTEEKLITLLEDIGGTGHDVEDVITNFVERITLYFAHYGEVFMELLSDDDGVKQVVTLPPAPIKHFLRRYAQIIPQADRQANDPERIYIPDEKMWHLKLPKELGSPKQHQKMIDNLNKLSEPMPKFALSDTTLGSDLGYDFMTHRTSLDIAVERQTYRWGSIPSLNQIRGTSEYYYMFNRLKFSRAQALIREHTIEELNKLLQQIGFGGTIKIEGLPLAREISNTIPKLSKGEVGFEEVVKLINP